MLALVAALSMTMMGKVNVQAKSPTYWYYSGLDYNKNKYYVKWNKTTLRVYSKLIKVNTTSYIKAKDYKNDHLNKYKECKKTFKLSSKVKLQFYEEDGNANPKFHKATKKEMMTWEPIRFSYKVQRGVVTNIVVDVDEYLGA